MRELARRLNVRHTWIGKIEQAERRLDLLEYLRLCEALGVDPHEGLDLLGPASYTGASRKKPRTLLIAAENHSRYSQS